ncbi:hypothetical protein JCM19238_2171 [Vibrio ponticus]|uniref:DUF6482 family protein n=1 Tax=Vibrio rhodolitus TaxID=2231649 RepID=UPI00050560C0|nr:DUF6482 family protein [Vibrio rhodolitus]GAK84603.1 hypothetical protein JCM19238_2171 [Vibrio ponticus]
MNLELELMEGGNYLAVEVDGESRRVLRAQDDSFIKFQSLAQAKASLVERNYASIGVVQRNLYDEMCGESVVTEINTTPLDWS